MTIVNRFVRRNLNSSKVEVSNGLEVTNALRIANIEKTYQPVKKPIEPAPILKRNVNPASNTVLTLSTDGSVQWGKRFNVITKSLDNGKTFVDSEMPWLDDAVTHAEFLKDGHLLVWTVNTTTGAPSVFKSSDANLDANTTWELKLQFTHALPNNAIYGLSVHNNVILFNEYIKWSGQTGNARHVWLSTDFGETWKNVFTLPDDSPIQHHTHDCAFDPYSKWLWVVTGDGAAYRNNYYSKDFGETWDTLWEPGQAPVQFTNVIARPECVLFGTDSPEEFSVYRYDKATGETTVAYDILPIAGTKPLLAVAARNITEEDGTVVTYIPWLSEALDNKWRLIATPDGYNYYELYVTPVNDGKGFQNVLGVTADNKLLIQGSGFTAEMERPVWK